MWLRCLNAAFYKWNVKKRKPLYLYLRKADCVWLIQNITWIFFSFKALKLYCCFNVVIFFSIQNNNKFSIFWLFILGTCDSFSECGIWAQFSRRTLSVINHPPLIGTFGILFVPYCNVFFKECTLLNNCWSHILFMIVFFFLLILFLLIQSITLLTLSYEVSVRAIGWKLVSDTVGCELIYCWL